MEYSKNLLVSKTEFKDNRLLRMSTLASARKHPQIPL